MKDFRELDRVFEEQGKSEIFDFFGTIWFFIGLIFEGRFLRFMAQFIMDVEFSKFKHQYIMEHEDVRRQVEMSRRRYVECLREDFEDYYLIDHYGIDLKKYD